jgi:hypothetical protein
LYPEQTLFTSANVVKTRNLFRVIQQTRQLSLAFLFIMGSLSSYTIFANEQVVEIIQAQFVRYDPDYHTHYENYGVRLDASANKLARLEAQGRNLHCSKQIFLEAKWLHRYTAHWDELDDKLERLELSFEEEDQEFANRQSPTTGFWGTCYESYFMRMGATVDALSALSLAGKTPRYKIRGTGEFSTGKKLLTRLQDLLISDIARTGVNNRAQLSSLITSISQGLFKDYIREGLERSRDARFDSKLPGLEDAFRFFLSGAQDPQTGYWGAWYIIDGKVHKTSDLSMTYHIVSYTKGKGLERWQNLITTTLAIESDPYPYGWKHREEFNNHNLYDVAKIFKYGWRHMKPSQRASISTQIQSMLDWSLSNTLGEDGRFIYKPEFSDSLADEYYFGVSFYDVIGYWNPEYRFWTDQSEFEGAMELCCQIERRLNELDLSGWAADGARAKLARNCTGC